MVLVLGRWKRAAFSVALASSLFVSIGEASACEPPPTGWFPASFAPSPANGVVVVTYSCGTDCETLPAVGNLSLRGEEGALVPGSVVFSEHRGSDLVIAFRPEPGALREARVYTAELDGLSPLEGILVSPAIVWNDALTPTEQIFEVDHPRGETACCKGPIDSCGNTACFQAEIERRTTVTLRWNVPQSPEHYQYAARFGRDRIDPDEPWSWDFGNVRLELDAAEESFCYVLELKRLTDDSVQTFESRCLERPASFTPGVHRTPDEDIAQALKFCDEPPDGYEKAWCEARAETCDVSPDDTGCSELAARCAMTGTGGGAGTNAGGTGNGGTAGTSGGTSGGAGDSTAQGGTAGTGDAEAGEAGEAGEGKRVLTEGCGCSIPGSGSRDTAPWTLAVALIALRLRRALSL